MKAFLLAAGYGTRLKPITDMIPKCMVPIQDVPLLTWWMRLFQKHGIDQVLINTHYLRGYVADYIEVFNNQHNNIKIVEAYETKLTGSGGTVKNHKDFLDEDEEFLICYADNLTNINLTELIQFHRSHTGILTMALFRANNPRECGIASLGEDDIILEFVEKPRCPLSNLANAGIYVANRRVLERLPDREFIDFGKDILPELAGKMYGWEIKDYLIDIGTPDNYKRAQGEWKYDYYKNTL